MSKKECDKQGGNEGGDEGRNVQEQEQPWPEILNWRQFYPDAILASSR